MTNNTNIIDENILFYQNYFFLARLGSQELLNPKHKKDNGLPILCITQDLIIPIIYCVKHGMELFYKSIILMKDEKCFFSPNPKIKINNTHDILFLYSWFEKIIISQIKGELINYPKGSSDIKNMEEDDIKNDLLKIKELTNYFYNNDWLGKNSRCGDGKNDATRYAESKIAKKIDWENEISIIEKIDVKVIFSKIKNLHDILNQWGYICETV